MPLRATRMSGSVIVESVVGHSDDDVETILAMAHALSASTWPRSPIEDRLRTLRNFASCIAAEAEPLAMMVARDRDGRVADARSEVRLGIDILRHYVAQARALLAPHDIATAAGGMRCERRPVGVVLCCAPRDFSFYRHVRMVGCNLAVGNPVLAGYTTPVPSAASGLALLLRAAGAPGGAWSDLQITRTQQALLLDDDRIHAIAMAPEPGSPPRSRAASSVRKQRIDLGSADLFAVPDDPEDTSKTCTSSPRGATRSFLANFTAPLLEHRYAGSPTPFHPQERTTR